MENKIALQLGWMEIMFIRLIQLLKTHGVDLKLDEDIGNALGYKPDGHPCFALEKMAVAMVGDFRLTIRQEAQIRVEATTDAMQISDHSIDVSIDLPGEEYDEKCCFFYEGRNKWLYCEDGGSEGFVITTKQAFEKISSMVSLLESLRIHASHA